MIVPDTNIWIEFFRQSDHITPQIKDLLKHRQIATLEPIFSELIYGVRTNDEKEIVLSYWRILPKLNFSLLKAAEFANSNNYLNLGIGLIDALIIEPVISNNLKLWTLDKKISRVVDAQFLY